jgi:hypothetical protein
LAAVVDPLHDSVGRRKGRASKMAPPTTDEVCHTIFAPRVLTWLGPNDHRRGGIVAAVLWCAVALSCQP